MTLEAGTPLSCKCPKCNSTDLLIRESFIVSDVYTVRDGKFANRDRGDDISATGVFYGECQRPGCDHIWRFRKSPISEADS